jgi:cytochrome c oxidase subunit 2
MLVVVILILVLVGSVLFTFMSPYKFTPLASNWGTMDDTLIFTAIITGIVFIAVCVFMIYCIYKFRHVEGRVAAYEPENKKLEWWLTILTTIGIVAMLAPGLIVWADYVNVPEDAVEVEAVGQQWYWTFRLPGEDGVMGKSAIRHMNYENPLGVDPDDPHGRDDVIIEGSEVHLVEGTSIKLLLRSVDVLHDFYVPNFRAKMDLVPGLVSYFWFTPTRQGTYEIICAEYCGTGHSVMRGTVVVESQEAYDAWLSEQTIFSDTLEIAKEGNDQTFAQAQAGGSH